ncbi:hypothetical protein L6164_033394 [Bauhinia variegata]|uniref:Uncharacterized protein n=1 Tax=Bauhinia variegata TaxID=167791 RepID=A0ACB9KRI7_BAUVA|nr:hypothetical protein L6164_033394 [Bauhinia variegata]
MEKPPLAFAPALPYSQLPQYKAYSLCSIVHDIGICPHLHPDEFTQINYVGNPRSQNTYSYQANNRNHLNFLWSNPNNSLNPYHQQLKQPYQPPHTRHNQQTQAL